MERSRQDSGSEFEAEATWLCRENYYNEMSRLSREARVANPWNRVSKLFSAIGNALAGRTEDSLNELSELTSETSDSDSTLLAALCVKSLAPRLEENGEGASVSRTEARIREEKRKASGLALARAATVFSLFKKFEKAREYADRAAKLDPNDRSVLVAWAWVYLAEVSARSTRIEAESLLVKCRESFETAKEDFSADLNFGLASAKLQELRGDRREAISQLSALVVRYPNSRIPLVEKMRNQLSIGDWEEAISSVDRALTIDNNSTEATKAQAVVTICRDSDLENGLKHVRVFFRNLIATEANNFQLILDSVQLFSRISNRDEGILLELSRITEKLAEWGKKKWPRTMIELGNVYRLAGRIADAEEAYKEAVRIDESSFTALTGLASCRVMDKQASLDSFALARQQIDFLQEIVNEASLTDTATIRLASAKLYANEPKKALENIRACVQTILRNLSSRSCRETSENFASWYYPGYYEYLNDLNPLFCLDVVEEYLVHCPRQVFNDTEELDRFESSEQGESNFVCQLLERVVDACPGMAVALLMLAKVRAQTGYPEEALVCLKRLVEKVDPTNSAGHLLTAQIHAHQARYDLAEQSLELGLSHDFRVRDDPVYHLIASMVHREKGRTEERIDALERAIELVESSTNERRVSSNLSPLSTSDKATLYIELAAAHASLRNFGEASRFIERAESLFGRSLEESRIVVAGAELCLEMGDVDRAVERLSEILPGNPCYLEARTKLARIHLERRKDRRAFAKCFRELVEHRPGPRTYGMLGDAYMAIQEPEGAIEAYEEALAKNPQDVRLAEKMGKALTKTHQYGRAIGYYREIVKNESCSDLRLDLAELYTKVRQFDKAENVLVQELQENRGANDLPSLEKRGRRLALLAKVRAKAGNLQSALTTLKEAKDIRTRCLQRTPLGDTSVSVHKQILAGICLDMANHASSLRDYDQAIDRYKEALSYKPADIEALLSLAKLYMQVNDLDRCGQSCMALLDADPDNEAASVMMADLAFRKVDFETAAFHFRQLLLRRPTYWTALARLIEVSRRTGNTSDLDEWLKRAATAAAAVSDGSNIEAGYHYCSGLLDWRTGKLNSALRSFNRARRDPEWGQQAIYNMIEICLDPDDDSALSSEAFNDGDDDDDGSEYQDSRTMALKTARRLLLELSPKGNAHETLTHRLLGDFFLLATKQKSNIERALQDCTSLASQENLRDHVGPALGLAMAHILMKQTPRARNHLKRVSKNVWTFEDAEYLERCWLLLADIYVQSSKYELANELLKRVLQHNATCVRARELSGQIAEREQNYREAAIRYGQAWKYGGKIKLSVGYKLAYCSFKCKAYADAIQVCNDVLKQDPDFPRIKKDILEKSVNNIRS